MICYVLYKSFLLHHKLMALHSHTLSEKYKDKIAFILQSLYHFHNLEANTRNQHPIYYFYHFDYANDKMQLINDLTSN